MRFITLLIVCLMISAFASATLNSMKTHHKEGKLICAKDQRKIQYEGYEPVCISSNISLPPTAEDAETLSHRRATKQYRK